MVYFFKGDGKGKTSACLGVTVRALLSGWKVCWISFFKEPSWQMSEMGLPEKFENLEMYFSGKGFYIKTKNGVNKVRLGRKKLKQVDVHNSKIYDHAGVSEHKRAASDALNLASSKIGKVNLLVLDEVANAIEEGLLSYEKVKDLLEKRQTTHVVLSGRGNLEELAPLIDLISEVKKVKHPFDRGEFAVKGLDF